VRAQLAYCLGLLGREMYEDLNTIREIRNQFAHEHRSLSFNDQSIKGRCQKIKAWLKLQLSPELGVTGRDRFIVGVAHLAAELILRGLSLQHARPGADFETAPRVHV